MATDNFLMLIGAPKCGTSSLASWLNRHDRVVLMPGKEPGYFRTVPDSWVLNAHRPDVRTAPAPGSAMVNRDTYMAPSLAAAPDRWILDGSTDYLSDDNAAARIKAFAEGRTVKLICMLRDPVERALSEYRHTIRDGLEPLSLAETVAQEETRRAQDYQPLFRHIRRSRYYDDIHRFRALFGEDLMILGLSEFAQEDHCTRRILDFIGLPAADLGPIGLENATTGQAAAPHARWAEPRPDRTGSPGILRQLYRRAKTAVAGPPPRRPMPRITEQDRALLTDHLVDDIRNCVMDPAIPTDDWTCTDTGASRAQTPA